MERNTNKMDIKGRLRKIEKNALKKMSECKVLFSSGVLYISSGLKYLKHKKHQIKAI